MLRGFINALRIKYPPIICSRNSNWSFKMSSTVAVDSLKRKPDEINSETSETKKAKTSTEENVDLILSKAAEETNKVRKPKKVILLMCYLGKEYYGMQRNTNVSTVEEELLKALLEAKIILKGEFDFPKTMKFQRAARTDKGVSAVRQIVSLKIPVKEICKELPEKINQYLPPEVRVVGVKRVTQSFDAKIACDARTYSYMIPTFAFENQTEGNAELYRVTDGKMQEVNSFLKNYLGTHNFYNFTSGRLPGDPSCKRYILSIECSAPFESCGLEFSVIQIKGQSFMLHQIRKMVGLAIAIMRNLADNSVLDKAWLNERIDIPKAPGLGLMLEDVHYDWYNSKYGYDGMHELLQWNEYDDIIEKFKKEKICSSIAMAEREEKSMLQWLETLPHHSYDVRDNGPPSQLPPKLAENNVITAENDTNNSENKVMNAENDVINPENEVPEDASNVDNVSVSDNNPETKKGLAHTDELSLDSSENSSVNSSETEVKCER